ncbi:2-oxoacid:acceptor oxidoreductase family protein [Sporohalobacter salinus]|uniref:2-oxoacid:acceptor oxidoreductase family protein n=1 Tax=Sporohalobacter salinus TaxID=1494606 RepID=UPI0019616E2A|nr:2-oxoacid:acceptor oxidoreductase family protein [Sporohalobacter salinus]MBM7622785.1 2-oxoglutarate ferredoxin oxidoreductase subunit gamma [Sporohalobacter salinus]
METEEMILAGFGGQGVMLMGKLLCHAGMKENKEVSWMPSYGPEMRGGTANCTVIISEEMIASPVVSEPSTVIVMNRPSLDKFEPQIKEGGNLFVNTSLIDKEPERDDINIIEVPANEIADELGNNKIANMAMLGAVIEELGLVDLTSIVNALEDKLSKRNRDLLPLNKKALDKGKELVG